MAEDSIERRLVGREWQTVRRRDGGGGSLPAGGSTGEVLTKESNADGDVGWEPSGGSQPDTEGKSVGDLLQLISHATGAASPTVAEVDSDARFAKLLAVGWVAGRAYQDDRQIDVPGATDNVQFLKPTGSDNIFIAEVNASNTSGTEEPAWDDDAPNLGDPISDGDYTWYNAGPYSAWPFTPATWQAETEYAAGEIVYPTTPNGHIYVAFPPGPLTSDTVEPVFPTDGSYVADNDGYWWDAGVAVDFAEDWGGIGRTIVKALAIAGDEGQAATLLKLKQASAATTLIELFNLAFNPLAAWSVRIEDDGTIIEASDSDIQEQHDPAGFSHPARIYRLADVDGLGHTGMALAAEKLIVGAGEGDNTGVVPVLFIEPGAAPADAMLRNGEASVWYDDTNGAAKLQIKAKTANGTVVTGNVALSA